MEVAWKAGESEPPPDKAWSGDGVKRTRLSMQLKWRPTESEQGNLNINDHVRNQELTLIAPALQDTGKPGGL